MQLYTNLFKRYEERYDELDLINDCYCSATGGVSAYFYFDSETEECWLRLNILDDSNATIETYIAIVHKFFVAEANHISYDQFNDAAYGRSMIEIAKSALSHATYHQSIILRKVRHGGCDLELL